MTASTPDRTVPSRCPFPNPFEKQITDSFSEEERLRTHLEPSPSDTPWARAPFRLARPPLSHLTEKFAYVSLNVPTPCPSRSAVPFNLGKSCCIPGGFPARTRLGMELTNVMREAGSISSTRQSDLSHENNFRSSERNWIASRMSLGRISIEPARSARVRATFRIRSWARAEKFISSIACSR